MTAAAFVLQLAAESSASTIAEARQEADRILSRARGEASTILCTARRQAEQVAADALDGVAQPHRALVSPPRPDEPPGQPRAAWHHRPAFMLTFGVVAIILTISSVGYRLMLEPQTVAGGAAVTADSHASLLHVAGGLAGGPGAGRAVAGSDRSAPAPAPVPVRTPDPGESHGRAHSIPPVKRRCVRPEGPGPGRQSARRAGSRSTATAAPPGIPAATRPPGSAACTQEPASCSIWAAQSRSRRSG